MKRKINEIFESLQGEGAHTGVPSVFVRFSGCNKRCAFCDTRHEEGELLSDEEIVRRVKGYNAPWIVLTGGEPSLWIDSPFVRMLKEQTGKRIAIETNGSCPVPEEIDWVTVSPKCGMEGAGDYEIRVAHADELKVVDLGQPLDPYFSYPCVHFAPESFGLTGHASTRMYLQPCYVPDPEENLRNRNRTIARIIADPRWTLSVQLHRFLSIP